MAEGFGLLWLIATIIGLCITVAPLILWRNTNRTNRLLSMLVIQNGADPKHVAQVASGRAEPIRFPNGTKICPNCSSAQDAKIGSCRICGAEMDGR
jgi:hypothetical protein